MNLTLNLVIACTLGACVTTNSMDSASMDSGTMDSGTVDSGTVDSGTVDSGTMDSGDPHPSRTGSVQDQAHLAPEAIHQVLDDWHAAAADGDEVRYMRHFGPEAVFLGTDASERWTLEEFGEYVALYFPQGGWTYKPHQREVMLAPGARVAWIDELLVNEKYGTLRGTGVLRICEGQWRIVHYCMSFAVPNERSGQVVECISAPD